MRSGRIEVLEGGRRRALRPAPTPTCGRPSTVNDPAAWRGPLRGSLGLGETYVDGALGDRRPGLADPHRRPRAARPRRPARRRRPAARRCCTGSGGLVPENTRGGARENISAHYDLGNDLFAAFLDERMMYSCAYFPRPGASLEEAQLAKLDRICEQLRLGPDNHLLEIGTGWGGLAVHAAREHRLPGDDDDDLPRAARAGHRSGSARPGSRTG